MSGATSNYSELDEERFRVWLGRLAESCKEYLTDNESEGEGGNGGLTQEALVSGIHSALQSDSAHYPPWLKAHKSIVAGRLASSSEEIKVFLRHVAMPHALHGYTRTVREIFTTASASASASAPVVEGTEGIEGIEGTEAAVEAEGVEVEMAVPTTITTTITPPTDLQCGATMRLPMHLGPVLAPVRPPSRRKGAKGGGYEEVDAFFQGLVSGCGDGVVGLCKLADAQHRVNRADQHDDHQLAQWIENESARQKSSGLALAKREERLLVLRGGDAEGGDKTMDEAFTKLKGEQGPLQEQLRLAERQEQEARQLYEASIQRRKAVGQCVLSLDSFLVAAATQRTLLERVNDLRLEADRFNSSSAVSRIQMLRGLRGYVEGVRERFVRRRLAKDLPLMFESLCKLLSAGGQVEVSVREGDMGVVGVGGAGDVGVVADVGAGGEMAVEAEEDALAVVPVQERAGVETGAGAEAGTDAEAGGEVEEAGVSQPDPMSLYCASRVGLETVRLWRQLALHNLAPELARRLDEFEAHLRGTLLTQAAPAPTPEGRDNATVVLFFDHLQHDTPEDHVEHQSRVLTCMKTLSDRLAVEPQGPESESDTDTDQPRRSLRSAQPGVWRGRALSLVRCNDILCPPMWCLPLAHSPQYLSQLWRLADEATVNDLFVPLEFDTEWIDEDPYQASDEESPRRGAPRSSDLLRRMPLDEVGQEVLGAAQGAFLDLLTPTEADHLVAKVIRRIDAKEAVRTARTAKQAEKAKEKQEKGEKVDGRTKRGRKPAGDVVVLGDEEVDTPFGQGHIVRTSYRRDRLLTVQLPWGQAHLRAECVTFTALGAAENQVRKMERNSISAAQAFYISGSGGRFGHTDLELHNTLARLVGVLKVQKTLCDLLELGHANFSLYMHGRTSAGLTRNIEGQIRRWVGRHDVSKMMGVVARAEERALEGRAMDAREILRVVEDTCTLPGRGRGVKVEAVKVEVGVEGAEGAEGGEMEVEGPDSPGIMSVEDDVGGDADAGAGGMTLDERLAMDAMDEVAGESMSAAPSPVSVTMPTAPVTTAAVTAAPVAAAPVTVAVTAPAVSAPVESTPVPTPAPTPAPTPKAMSGHQLSSARRGGSVSSSSSDDMESLDGSPRDRETRTGPGTGASASAGASAGAGTGAGAGAGAGAGVGAGAVEIPKASVSDIKTIGELHSAVTEDLRRRNVSQSRAALEANLQQMGGQPALSKFLAQASISNTERGKAFSMAMLEWVARSRFLGDVEAWKGPLEESHVLLPGVDWDKPSPSQGPLEGDDLTCGVCGKQLSDFPSSKSFHMHLAWCYRRKNQTRPPPDHMLKSEDSKKRPRGAEGGGGAKRPRVDGRKSVGGGSEDPFSDPNVMQADSFYPNLGGGREACEGCKKFDRGGPLLRCSTCPGVYHEQCDGDSFAPSPDSAVWSCPKCRENDVVQQQPVAEELKESPDMVGKWILMYSEPLRRWRKAVVLALHLVRPAVLLVKWWRSDGKGGKSNWINTQGAGVLWARPESVGLATTRVKIDQLARQRQARLRDLGVEGSVRAPPGMEGMGVMEVEGMGGLGGGGGGSRVSKLHWEDDEDDEEEDERPRRGQRSRESRQHVHMDGEGGSVPPRMRNQAAGVGGVGAMVEEETDRAVGMSDTYISSNSLKAALCASGVACRAVDIAVCNDNTNVFACTRPPGHHAGRYGCTGGCLSTGFCLLNNAAIAAIYARVRWGLERVAVVDIDVHFGNGTAELLKDDPQAFFASVHMIYGEDNDGTRKEEGKPRPSSSAGFYPSTMGTTEVTDNYVSVGVYPQEEKKKRVVEGGAEEGSNEEGMRVDAESAPGVQGEAGEEAGAGAGTGAEAEAATKAGADRQAEARTFVGSEGFLEALRDVIIPKMEAFNPQLLIISSGFDGYVSDPLGGQLCLSLEDYKVATKMLMQSMAKLRSNTDSGTISGRVISVLEGGYDTAPGTLGLARCVDAHVQALQEG